MLKIEDACWHHSCILLVLAGVPTQAVKHVLHYTEEAEDGGHRPAVNGMGGRRAELEAADEVLLAILVQDCFGFLLEPYTINLEIKLAVPHNSNAMASGSDLLRGTDPASTGL